jgi:signal transduction histidine kinase
LVVFGAGLAWVVYQQMIAPLQLKVIESRDLAARQEKLASLGMLAAGVAHEIRNPLTAMKARLFALRRLIEPDAPEQDDLGVMDKEIDRLERIVTEFLQFARPAEPALETVDAARPLAEVHKLMASQLEKNGIRLVLENSETIMAGLDMHQIQQVLINLVQNAADSIGRNGVITLRVRSDTKRLNGRVTGVAILEVSDTGGGIPPEIQKRLFDPFFTTKEAGTGLGLSIAARIVEKHGGLLQYISELNSGTTFGIVLPETKPHESHGKNPVG